MLLVVARIGRAHGVLGEATIEVRTDQPEDRFKVGTRLITDPATIGPLTIASVRDHNGTLLLGFEGITDRNSIEKLRNTLIYCDVDIDEPGVHEDDYHVLQLIGCAAHLESGVKIGEVTDVVNLPGQDLLAIKVENGEILIPFVHQLVPVVDIAAKKVTVIPPELSGVL